MSTKVKINANIQTDNHGSTLGKKSLKSIRSYQVGIVYRDKYGRETPVFTNESATFSIPKNFSDKQNFITTSIESDIPEWADSYKYFVKETSNEYYNICMDRWYDAEDDNIWLSFPSAERNKLQEDGFIILKKQAEDAGAVYEEARYKVIDIQNEAPLDVKTNYEWYGSKLLTITSGGAVPGGTTITIAGGATANEWESPSNPFYDSLLIGSSVGKTNTGFVGWPLEDVVIQLSKPGARTPWLDVANISWDGTNAIITLSKPLIGTPAVGSVPGTGPISSVVDPGGSTPTVRIAKKVVKHKPEFDGHFFVKIKRDNIINDKVRSTGSALPSFNVVASQKVYSMAGWQQPDDLWEDLYKDFDENFFIDTIKRRSVGTGGSPSTGNDGPWVGDDGWGTDGTRNDGYASPCSMEISLNKIKDGNSEGFSVGSNTAEKIDFFKKLASQGTMFRWREDPYQIIYQVDYAINTIDDSWGRGYNYDKQGIYNYGSKGKHKKRKSNKAHRMNIRFKTTGYRLAGDDLDAAGGQVGNFTTATTNLYVDLSDTEANLYPFNHGASQFPSQKYTPPRISATLGYWHPNKQGYGNDWYATTSATTMTNAGITSSWESNVFNINNLSPTTHPNLDEYYNTIEIIETDSGDIEPIFSKNPAVWETEPREDVGLDIYYEASQAYPLRLNQKTSELFAPKGCVVTCDDVIDGKTFYLPDNTILYAWSPTGHGSNTIILNKTTEEVGILDTQIIPSLDEDPPVTPGIQLGTNPDMGDLISMNFHYAAQNNPDRFELKFTRPDGSFTTAKVIWYSAWHSSNHHIDGSTYLATPGTPHKILLKLDRDISKTKIKLPYFNCYSFGNGVESDRVRDDFNAVTLGKGVKASTVLEQPYEEEQKTNGLIYSGIYSSNSGLNSLNQFIAAEAITKEVAPRYGSIQLLKSRDTDLVAFCEDKILKIPANKDILYNADGGANVTASNKVLGTTTSFKGEFGISKNPESYAQDSFRMYCTDKQRGKVLRISGDGITPISEVGMIDYLADSLKLYDNLIGSFDDRKGEYNLTLKNDIQLPDPGGPKRITLATGDEQTISFSEAAKGWISFKSFIPENGLSINNNYYTFKNGELWQHHINETRNNFYGDDYNSHVDILFNEESATVKSFASMKYEGTQSKITQNLGSTVNGVFYPDNEYHNNIGKPGWYVESGITDLQEAGEMEFKNKEGKWFSYMKGKSVTGASDLDSKEFSFQGIDLLESIVDGTVIPGCMDPTALNYDPNATQDDGSCLFNPPDIYGCTDRNATNFDPGATIDDGSCVYTAVIEGCMDPSATNYNPAATIDDGSCIIPTYGCTDPAAINYFPGATADDGSCVVCSSLNILVDVDPHLMLHLSNGIRVISYLTADDLPYTVACTDSSGTLIGDSAGSFGWSAGTSMVGDVVFFGQSSILPTDTYTITITTAHGCTSQETILLDNGAPPTPTSFQITVQDIGDQDPVAGQI